MQRHFESIGSTNEAAKEWAQHGTSPAPHGAIISADEQTAGRGRRGRDWVSPAGKGVYLSIVWRPQIELSQIGQLTIVAAIGAARALEKIGGAPIETKWPNDLLLRRKKIGGILCEAEIKNNEIDFVVAGVGLNANLEECDLPPRTIFPATSLLMETQKTFDVEELRNCCIESLYREYSRYEAGNWQTLRAEFISRCALIGEKISIRQDALEYSGVATGIDDDGFLIVQTSSETRRVMAGDISFSDH